MEANVRASPAVHVRRSPPTTYMTVARQAPRPAPGPALARTPHADPHRLGRRRPRVRELARAARTVAVLLDRHGDHRGDPPGRAAGPRLRLDGHPRSRRQDPRRGMGRRTGRRRPAGLGGRHATDRPQGTPPPGAPLRITDADDMRITCFATNTSDLPVAALELRHRQRARTEDRIRAARDSRLPPSSPPRPALALDPDDHRRIRLPPGPVRARLTNRNTPCPDKPETSRLMRRLIILARIPRVRQRNHQEFRG